MRYTFLLLVLFASTYAKAQLNSYSANELDSLQYVKERPVVFFINTDWCSICLGMENKVLKSEKVAEKLNSDFYFTFLNAESKEDVVFKGKRYVYEATGADEGKHQLAMRLARKDGAVSFPSTVIMLGNDVIYKSNSFMSKEDLMNILNAIMPEKGDVSIIN